MVFGRPATAGAEIPGGSRRTGSRCHPARADLGERPKSRYRPILRMARCRAGSTSRSSRARATLASMGAHPTPVRKRGAPKGAPDADAVAASQQPVQREAEGHGQEHAHLLAADRRRGAVVAAAAAGHHAAARQLLDPAAERAGGGDVGVHRRPHGGGFERRVQRPQHEDRHLLAGDRAAPGSSCRRRSRRPRRGGPAPRSSGRTGWTPARRRTSGAGARRRAARSRAPPWRRGRTRPSARGWWSWPGSTSVVVQPPVTLRCSIVSTKR